MIVSVDGKTYFKYMYTKNYSFIGSSKIERLVSKERDTSKLNLELDKLTQIHAQMYASRISKPRKIVMHSK